MKFVLFALLAVIATSLAQSDVLTLDADNFDSSIEAHEMVLVEFYAPWCGHCKHLAPEWEKAATALKDLSNLKIAKIDADEAKNADIRNRYEIRGFPTLKLFRNGKVNADYSGDRTADAIASYMRKQAAPASTQLTAVDAAQAFKDSDRVVVIGFFDNVDSAEYKTFKNVANQLRDSYTFGEVVGDSAINTALGASSPSVTLFKKFDELKNEFTDLSNEEAFATFVKTNSVPLIDEIGPHNFKTYVESNVPLAYLFVDLTQEGSRDLNQGYINDLAKETKGKINWVIIDWAKYAKHSERLGLSGKTVPALAIERLTDGTHFVFDEQTVLSKEGIATWVQSFLDGKINPTIKSEEVPADNDGPVKVVVANNFAEVVYDKTKDVLVEFYAPWCGHCKKLTPIYEELGQNLKKSYPDVVIAKIDATANDIDPKFNVRGFPTLKFFPANNKDTPTDYEGDRSLSDMRDFIEDHATTKGSGESGKDEL